MAYAELTPVSGGPTVHLDAESDTGLMLGTVAGWYGTPSAKVDMTEMAGGNGAFSIRDDGILYSARTVTLGICASGDTYAEMVRQMDSVGALSGKMVRLLIDGDDGATTATGYMQVEWDEGPMPTMDTGTLTIVCPDPRRYGSDAKSATLVPGGNASGGLDLTDARLAFPLAWGDQAARHSVATMRNDGTSTAYPTISIQGAISDVVLVDTSTGRELTIPGYIGWQPIVLDCLSRTAGIAGVDVTRRLGQRNFPSIPAGGDTTIALMCRGTNGTVHVEWRDTYI